MRFNVQSCTFALEYLNKSLSIALSVVTISRKRALQTALKKNKEEEEEEEATASRAAANEITLMWRWL